MIFFTSVENERFLHRFFTFPHRFKDFFISPTHIGPCHPSPVICVIHWIDFGFLHKAVKVLFHWIFLLRAATTDRTQSRHHPC